MQEIKVLVPEDRVPDFYKWFGAWLDGSEQQGTISTADIEKSHWANPEDRELAAELWAKLSENAQALFGYLMDRPGEAFTGDDLAAALAIPNGRYGVAGVLAWPGRYCLAMRRHLPSQWSEDKGTYWMEPDVAEMFVEIRDSG
jgi:hypothetical protein